MSLSRTARIWRHTIRTATNRRSKKCLEGVLRARAVRICPTLDFLQFMLKTFITRYTSPHFLRTSKVCFRRNAPRPLHSHALISINRFSGKEGSMFEGGSPLPLRERIVETNSAISIGKTDNQLWMQPILLGWLPWDGQMATKRNNLLATGARTQICEYRLMDF